jgi:hypothetical protein
MMMVGYTDDHPADCYRMYNPITDRVVISRDVRWAQWTRADPTTALKNLQDLEPPVDAVMADPTQTDGLSDPHIIPDDDVSPDSDRDRQIIHSRQHTFFLETHNRHQTFRQVI